MSVQELGPGRFAALGTRIETGFFQDVDDRGSTDGTDAALLASSQDAGVPPLVFTGQPQHELANIICRPRSARSAGLWPPTNRLSAGPAEERSRRHNGDQVLDRRAE